MADRVVRVGRDGVRVRLGEVVLLVTLGDPPPVKGGGVPPIRISQMVGFYEVDMELDAEDSVSFVADVD